MEKPYLVQRILNVEVNRDDVEAEDREVFAKEVKKSTTFKKSSTNIVKKNGHDCFSSSLASVPKVGSGTGDGAEVSSSSTGPVKNSKKGKGTKATKPAPVWDAVHELDIELAREFLPPKEWAVLGRDDSRHYRWIVAYKGGPQLVYTKSWNNTLSPLLAFQQLCKTVWDVHQDKGRGRPTYRIDAIPSKDDA